MSNQMRILSAVMLMASLSVVLTAVVAFKAPPVKWSRIERQILSDVAAKIISTSEVSAEEEKVARENKYVLIKRQAFERLNNKKADEALALMTWIRERSDEDAQIDYYLAQAWESKDSPDNAAKYYQRVVERSTSQSEVIAALDYLSKQDKKTFIESVRDFITQQNKGDRFTELIATNKRPSRELMLDDKMFVFEMALNVVEGRQIEIMSLAAKAPNLYLGSEILKPYQTIEDGVTRLNLKQLGDDLVGKDNPQRKDTEKVAADAAVGSAEEANKK